MGFSKLIDKVTQAEQALEARERYVGAEWRQLKSAWRDAWTPGRIVVAGLASGFLVGRARTAGLMGGGTMQVFNAISGLIASGSAQVAASGADDAARQAEATVTVAGSTDPAPDAPAMMDAPDPLLDHEALRRRGLL